MADLSTNNIAWIDHINVRNVLLYLPCVLAWVTNLVSFVKERSPDLFRCVQEAFMWCILSYAIWILTTILTSLYLDEQREQVWIDHPHIAFIFYLLTFFLYAAFILNLTKLPDSDAVVIYVFIVGLFLCHMITTISLVAVPSNYLSKSETCTSEWIHANNSTGLHYAFRGQLFGQHLVEDPVKSAMHVFLKDQHPPRPLVMSFHGRTGTGKNHVSRLIAESVYTKGLDSKFVHLKIPSRDYPHENEVNKYKDNLQKEIHSSISRCPRQLFIFDEVENLPVGLLDAIKPYIDYNDKVEGVDFRKAIFIFLSNIGGKEIMELTLNHKGERKTIRIRNLENVIEKAAFNQKGAGLFRSRLLDSHLIGHFIPFLPLERRHIELCIKEEFMKIGLPPPSDKTVHEVVEELQFWPEDTKKYAVKGCKNVREKVSLFAYTQEFKTHNEL